MSTTQAIHKGMVIRHDGHLYTITDYSTAQTGKQKATVHVKMRSLPDGRLSERTLDQLGQLEEVQSEVRPMQFLYSGGAKYVFMDAESFEQHELDADLLGDTLPFLVEEDTYRILTVDGRPASLQLPTVLVYEVIDTAPVEHGSSGSNVTKEAKLNGGLTVRVPLFIKNGDRIRVGVEHRDYQGKEH